MSFDKKKYNLFINSLDIKNIIIPEMSWNINDYPGPKTKLTHETNLEIPALHIEEDKIIKIPAKLKVIGTTARKKKPFMEISITIHLLLSVDPELFSDEFLAHYMHHNAIFTIISVFREQVRNATFQMGLPPLVLPALKLNPPKNNSASAIEEKSHN
jgi:hypothetical protein